MIKDIKIQNYKLFKSLSLTNLPRILLIGGKNNSGKSSLLEAFFLPLDCGSPLMFLKHFTWRGLGNISNNVEDFFSPVFHNFSLNNNIKIEYTLNSAKKKKIAYKFQPSKSQTLTADNKDSFNIEQVSFSSLGEMEISYWLGIDKPPRKAILKLKSKGNEGALSLEGNKAGLVNYNEGIRAAYVAASAYNSVGNAKRYGELDKVNNTAGVLKALRVLEPKLSSLSIIQIGNQPVIHGSIEGLNRKFPLSLMGQGIVRLLSILLVISEVKNGLTLIDELETGFHHSVLADIWKVISKHAMDNNTQIIATTHSKDLISGAVEGIPSELKNEFKYMRIERKENDFKTKSYDFKTLSVALESELEIR